MELNRMALVIQRLAERTAKGEVVWKEETSNSFVAPVGKYSVSISEHDEMQDDPFSDPDYYFAINEPTKNCWMDSVSDEEMKDALPGSFKIMRSLYRDARRGARGIDVVVEELLKEIGDGKP